MSINHLTDEQLQSYTEGELKSDTNAIAEHLTSCETCRNQLKAYRFVQSGMTQAPPKAFFAEDFEDRLMSRILFKENPGFQIKDYLIAAFSIVMALGLLFSPFIYGQTGKLIMDSCAGSWSLLKDTLLNLFCYGDIGGHCIIIPVIIIVMILAFKILDKVYIQPRLKPANDTA
jgi:hypothetical protein